MNRRPLGKEEAFDFSEQSQDGCTKGNTKFIVCNKGKYVRLPEVDPATGHVMKDSRGQDIMTKRLYDIDNLTPEDRAKVPDEKPCECTQCLTQKKFTGKLAELPRAYLNRSGKPRNYEGKYGEGHVLGSVAKNMDG